MSRLVPAALTALILTALPAVAHEFWIEPSPYQVQSGAQLTADFRNGQNFEGSAYAYFPGRTERFDLIRNGQAQPYAGRMGDLPALQTDAGADGLLVIVHQTGPSAIKYSEWEKFRAFVAHKDLAGVLGRHRARGLPETGFKETYTRYAKALVGVGRAEGADAPTGMETEFVALANPYTDDLTAGFPVRVLYRAAPRADAQIEIFERAPDGTVAVTTTRTDAQGRAVIPVRAGHEYLLDAVVMREAPPGDEPVWESLWAAMTFALPWAPTAGLRRPGNDATNLS